MTESEDFKRTHRCGELTEEQLGLRLTVQGWVNRLRDHGGIIFMDMRDRWGVLQIVFNPEELPEQAEELRDVRQEFVISVTGTLRRRPEGTINEGLPTGSVELVAERFQILSRSEPPVFPIEDDASVDEALRLRYRYLDLRRPMVQRRLLVRHRCLKFIRDYLDDRDFVEVETPILTKSTPEGARDYLVPSRVHPGQFYALPQSPQLFKQLLMVAGLERYYQIARCFRDEDLRADRQPEFTQLDLEMSFVGEGEVMALMEDLIRGLFTSVGIDAEAVFPVMTYRESMDRYGTDSPDLRFGLELFDVTEEMRSSGFKVFRETVETGGAVKGLFLSGSPFLSRRELDELSGMAVEWGARGLVWLKLQDGNWSGPAAKFISEEEFEALVSTAGAREDGCLFLVADARDQAARVLGRLRLHLARSRGQVSPGAFRFAWVTDFPLVEWDDGEKRHVAVHHPFTAPKPEDIPLLEDDPGRVRARAYDLVLNGQEIGGGSIRIHRSEDQMRMFRVLGISPEEAEAKFGFLLEAFRYGAPPHGGIAMGLDRIVAILTGVDSIREVMAFPKTQKATCLLTGAPSPVAPSQLEDLHIRSAASRNRRGPDG